MSLNAWDNSVRIAKIRLGVDPNSFTMIKGKLLKEAQLVYYLMISGGSK
jgi:hypothetical protein